MRKLTILLTTLTVAACCVKSEAQVYIRPASYGDTYTVTQPMYTTTPQTYAAPVMQQPVAYYTGAAYGQQVMYGNGGYNPCCCAPVNPCVGQVAYQPVAAVPNGAAGCQPYYVRRGLLGQPTVYVPGQPVRNLLRFLTP